MACKEGQFDAVEQMVNYQFNTFSINLNAEHVNGMTPFYLYGYQILQITLLLTSVEALSDFEGKDDIAGKGNKLSTRSNEDGIELG